MSRRDDGTFKCDRCDVEIGNGGIDEAVSISDLERDERGKVVLGAIRILHLCRVNNCNDRVLTKRALAAIQPKEK